MPRGLTVTEVTDTSVSLRWSRPATDGGKPITRYIIEKRDPAKSTYIAVGTTTDSCYEFRVIRLVAGNEYVLQVSAENEVGVGEPAELSQGITAKSPYSKSLYVHVMYVLNALILLSVTFPFLLYVRALTSAVTSV